MNIKNILTNLINPQKKVSEETQDVVKVIEEAQNKIKQLSPLLLWFKNHLFLIFHPQNDVQSFIKETEVYRDKIIASDKKVQFENELWMLRYAYLFNWFIEINPPKDKKDLQDILVLLNSATKQALNKINMLNYLPILKQGLNEYNIGKLTFDNIGEFQSQFAKRVGEKTPLIIFDSTGGILGGEKYDDIRELIMIMIEVDKKTFEMGKKNSLTKDEKRSIKKEIQATKLTNEDIENALIESIESLN